MSVKGSVTIIVDTTGKAELDPPLGLLDRNIQTMQWSLVAPEEFKFSDPPIVFQSEGLPPGFVSWPGDTPAKENDWQVRAKVNKKVDKPEFYRYDIFVDVQTSSTNGGVRVERRKLKVHRAVEATEAEHEHKEKIDPDMENQPQP
ncbi:MAG TPA: hypothetical protein VHW00_17390 [Thermoanaerobaculia bacterium]|nr:hypothetical protein [Thermoanaerobaculia bacterium]